MGIDNCNIKHRGQWHAEDGPTHGELLFMQLKLSARANVKQGAGARQGQAGATDWQKE